MELSPIIICSITTLFVLLQIEAAPSERNADHDLANKELQDYQKQLEDENVQELKNLKSIPVSSLSKTKFHKAFYANENGKKEQHIESAEQVNQNGELIERMQQKINTMKNSELEKPKTHAMTEIEIPSEGIHKIYEGVIQREMSKKKYDFKHQYPDNKVNDNSVEIFGMKNIIRYQPEEMAEYIFETGDEKSVSTAVQNYLQTGVLNHKEVLAYLQQIKAALNMLEEREMREKKQEQRRFFENLYGNTKNKMDVNQALSDLKDIQQLIQDKYLKQLPEEGSLDRPYFKYDHNQEDMDGVENDGLDVETEKEDYRNLMEKLQNFENLFAKASMESVIYQLAKVLFYQSFSISGLEAQESIKQFSGFLEKQVEEGHISRNMERKVSDILLAALTDTLDEHPELLAKKTTEKSQQTSTNHNKNVTDVFMYKIVEKKNSQPSEKTHQFVKSLNLESSGILDDPKKFYTTN